jgi:hypothetical protein
LQARSSTFCFAIFNRFACAEHDSPPALDKLARRRSNLLSLDVTLMSPSNRLHWIFEPGRPVAIPRDFE